MNAPTWAMVARGARQALDNLGYPVKLGCLPGEADPCGGTDTDHVAAYFGTIKAIADHQLEHLGHAWNETQATAYWDTRTALGRCDNPPRLHTEFSSLNDD